TEVRVLTHVGAAECSRPAGARGGAGGGRVRRRRREGARFAAGGRRVVSAARDSGGRGRPLRRSDRGRESCGLGGGAARGPARREPARPAGAAQGGADATGVSAPLGRGPETSSRLNSLGLVPGTIYA